MSNDLHLRAHAAFLAGELAAARLVVEAARKYLNDGHRLEDRVALDNAIKALDEGKPKEPGLFGAAK